MRKLIFAAMLVLGAQSADATEISIAWSYPSLYRDAFDKTIQAFEKAHPDIAVKLLPPAEQYDSLLQETLRNAITNNVPDAGLFGLNQMRTLDNRGLAVDLSQFIKSDQDWSTGGYEGTSKVGRVGGHQVGLGYAISMPVVLVNKDLLTKANVDFGSIKSDWPSIVGAAKAVKALKGDTIPVYMQYNQNDWFLQALVLSQGGTILDSAERKVAFNGATGLFAVNTIYDLAAQGGMIPLAGQQGMTAFKSCAMGIYIGASSAIRSISTDTAGRCDIAAVPFPIPDTNGHLPVGGSAWTMLTQDPDKQKAVWTFLKFALSPESQVQLVISSGYLPTNALAANRTELLDYYKSNPLQAAALAVSSHATDWYPYPGQNDVKIRSSIVARMDDLVGLKVAPRATLDRITSDIETMLPK